MLSREDSRRLAQLERELRRDDPDFCERMSGGRGAPSRAPLALGVTAVVIWVAALVLGVVGWWMAAGLAALWATVIVVALGYRFRPDHGDTLYPLPPAW